MSKITTSLFWRVVIFLALFMVISGLLGPRIISGGILYRDGFGLYGGLGKASIFGVIAFWLLVRKQPRKVVWRPWCPVLLLWGAVSLVSLIVSWWAVNVLLGGERTAVTLLLAHAGLLGSVAAAALAAVGPGNIQRLVSSYRAQLLWAGLIAGLFYAFLVGVYGLWRPLAHSVLNSVHGLLALVQLPSKVMPPNILMTDRFSVTVAQYCSGVESIALFSGLYAVVGLLEWHHLRRRRFVLLLPLALLALFGLNIVRICVLILAGYYINPGIAFSLFHTYAGLLFFIFYSVVFWAVSFKYLLRPEPKVDEDFASH